MNNTSIDNIGKRRPYLNPYIAGLLLGLVLFLSYLTLGTGLGASSGVARICAFVEVSLAPARTLSSEYFGSWGGEPLNYYLVFMLAGVFFGGLISAMAANRCEILLERGKKVEAKTRSLYALSGGIFVGFASRLANGCTSGQALSGTAILATGSLVFLVCVFAGGYMAAWFVRRQWDD